MRLTLQITAIAASVFFALIIIMVDGESLSNFKKVVCIVRDKELLNNNTCTANAVNRHKTVLNINGHFTKRVDNIMVHIQLFRKMNVVFRPFLVNVTENFCKKFEKSSSSPYLNILLGIASKYTNLNHTCPYEGWFIFKDLELDLSSLKVLLPDGEYRLDVEPTINGAKIPQIILHFFFEFAAAKFG